MWKRKSRSVGSYWSHLHQAGPKDSLCAFDVGPLVLAGVFALSTVWVLVVSPTWCGAAAPHVTFLVK